MSAKLPLEGAQAIASAATQYHTDICLEQDLTILRALTLVLKRLREFRHHKYTGKIIILVKDGKALTVQREDAALVDRDENNQIA